MRLSLLLSFFALSFTAFSQEDYTIRINDSSFRIALDKTYSINVNGKKVNFIIKALDTLKYDDPMFSFLHTKEFKLSETKLDIGIQQVMGTTAEGTGFIVQKYSALDPSLLTETMLNEVTKESIGYGYKMEKSEYSRTLKSGQTLKVKKAVLTYKDEVNIYEVAAFGKKDEGILILTMQMSADESAKKERKIIDMMWETLRIK
jgi:hypothetical protein